MISVKIRWMVVLLAALCQAVTYNVSGTVSDSDGNGIEGAIVRLGIADIYTTTTPDGHFTLTGTNARVPPSQCRAGFDDGASPFISADNKVSFSITEKSDVRLAVYDMKGRLCASYTQTALPGSHYVTLPRFANGIHIYSITLNRRQYTFRGIAGQAKAVVPVSAAKDLSIAEVANTDEAIDDALLVSKSGYRLYRLPMTNPDTADIQISLSPVETGTVTDIEGNVYRTVKIGTQEWTTDNLRTVTYNDGTPIPLVSDSAEWKALVSPGCCFYNNETDTALNAKWGALYNWYVLNTGKLAPAGWHVPSDEEWNTLQNYLISNGYNYNGKINDQNLIAIAMASTTDWVTFESEGSPGKDLNINNSSGFSALPAGCRSIEGAFEERGYKTHWGCTTESELDTLQAVDHEVYYFFWYLGRLFYNKNFGSSVRLVRDN